MRARWYLFVAWAFAAISGSTAHATGKTPGVLTTAELDAEFGSRDLAAKDELRPRIEAIGRQSGEVIGAFWGKKATPTSKVLEAAVIGNVPGSPLVLGVSGGPELSTRADGESELSLRLFVGLGAAGKGRLTGVGVTTVEASSGAEQAKIPPLSRGSFGAGSFVYGACTIDGKGFGPANQSKIKSKYVGSGSLWAIGAMLRASIAIPLTAIKSPALSLALSAQGHARDAYVAVQCGRFDAARHALKKAETRMRWANKLIGRRRK